MEDATPIKTLKEYMAAKRLLASLPENNWSRVVLQGKMREYEERVRRKTHD